MTSTDPVDTSPPGLPSVLIVCQHFPPLNRTAARRPYHLARHLVDRGHRVTVITQAATAADDWITDLSGIEIVRLPLIKVPRDASILCRWTYVIVDLLESNSLTRSLGHVAADLFLPLNRKARLDLVPADILTRASCPDIILATGPGWQCFEYGHRLGLAWNTPLMLDYRDPWNIAIPEVGLDLMTNLGKGIIGSLRMRRMRMAELAFTRTAVAVTAATPPFLENALKVIGERRSLAVLNGHRPLVRVAPGPHPRLTLIYTGSVYEEQEWNIVLQGLKMIEQKRPDLLPALSLRLVGIDLRNVKRSRHILEELVQRAEVSLEDRMDRDATLHIQSSSDVLLHVGFKGKQGILPLKFLEYLHSGAPILQVSSDRDMQERIIDETRTGSVVGSAQALCEYLVEALEHWKAHGQLPYSPDKTALLKYTWEHQMELWRRFIISVVQRDMGKSVRDLPVNGRDTAEGH